MLEVDFSRRLAQVELNVRFSAGKGITALLGQSGAGKTFLVNHLAGLERPDRGRIAINGTELFDSEAGIDVPPEKRQIGYVFQEDRLFPHLSVASNLKYGMRLKPVGHHVIKFDEVVDLLGIGHLLDRRPHLLSGGEKQRVAIGRALLTSPEILLMDEPLASLDPARRFEILPFIERLRDELDMAIVYVSHSMEEIIRLADTVVVISRGRSIAHGGVEEIMNRLDLRPLTGRYDAGAVMNATVRAHDRRYALTELDVPAGTLLVPQVDLPVGYEFRVRIRARDVSLALEEPQDISILNRFRGAIAEISEGEGPYRDVILDVGCPLWCRITHRSAERMALAPGKEVWALVKAVAIDRSSLGRRGERRHREMGSERK